jgi:hypothetical protein
MTRNRVEEFIAAITKMVRVTARSVKDEIAYRWEPHKILLRQWVLGSQVKDDPTDVKSSAMISAFEAAGSEKVN